MKSQNSYLAHFHMFHSLYNPRNFDQKTIKNGSLQVMQLWQSMSPTLQSKINNYSKNRDEWPIQNRSCSIYFKVFIHVGECFLHAQFLDCTEPMRLYEAT